MTIDVLLLQLRCSLTFPNSSPMISRLPPDLACITIFSSAKAEILISWRGSSTLERLSTASSPWRSGDLYPMVWQQVGFVAAVCRICRSHLQRWPIPQQEWKLVKVSLKFSTSPWYFQTYPKIMTSKKQSPPPWCCWTSPRSSGQLWPGWNWPQPSWMLSFPSFFK